MSSTFTEVSLCEKNYDVNINVSSCPRAHSCFINDCWETYTLFILGSTFKQFASKLIYVCLVSMSWTFPYFLPERNR